MVPIIVLYMYLFTVDVYSTECQSDFCLLPSTFILFKKVKNKKVNRQRVGTIHHDYGFVVKEIICGLLLLMT